MKTTEYAVIDEKGRLTGFATMIEALQFAHKASASMSQKMNIVKITREWMKSVDPADCQ